MRTKSFSICSFFYQTSEIGLHENDSVGQERCRLALITVTQ